MAFNFTLKDAIRETIDKGSKINKLVDFPNEPKKINTKVYLFGDTSNKLIPVELETKINTTQNIDNEYQITLIETWNRNDLVQDAEKIIEKHEWRYITTPLEVRENGDIGEIPPQLLINKF